MTIEEIMQALVQAEKEGIPIDPVSDMAPGGLSLEDGHRICEANIQKRLDAGETVAGFKVGFTSAATRHKMGVPDSTYGYIMDSMVLKSGVDLLMKGLVGPKIECEICFMLGKDIAGKNLSIEQVLDATESICASFEICDARIIGWKCPYPDFFADNGFSCRVVRSGDCCPVGEMDFFGETVVLTRNGNKLAEGRTGSEMGHPANAIIWLAGKLADRGKGLKAGQFIMTGTLTPLLTIERGSTYTASFSSLGKIDATFY